MFFYVSPKLTHPVVRHESMLKSSRMTVASDVLSVRHVVQRVCFSGCFWRCRSDDFCNGSTGAPLEEEKRRYGWYDEEKTAWRCGKCSGISGVISLWPAECCAILLASWLYLKVLLTSSVVSFARFADSPGILDWSSVRGALFLLLAQGLRGTPQEEFWCLVCLVCLFALLLVTFPLLALWI